jgi:hypothetical protein
MVSASDDKTVRVWPAETGCTGTGAKGMNSVQRFIGTYSVADRERIAVQDNGKLWREARDRHEKFRSAVTAAVLADPDSASTKLIQDLYAAEAEWAGITNETDDRLGRLGQLVLEREGPRYVDVYWTGMCQGFDAYLAAASFPPPCDYAALGRKLVREVNRLLKAKLSAERRRRLKNAKEVFREWAERRDG